MMPLITVIVPVYNAEKYLRSCLESILKQTFKEMEVILVDDGSKDSSGRICDEFAEKDNRIKVIHQENKRAAAARNAGIKIAQGEYISFVDSDDTLEENFLMNLYSAAKKYEADIAVSPVKTIPETDENYVNYWSFWVKKKILVEPDDRLGVIFSCAVWNKLYRTECLKQNNISFFEDLFLEDVTFNQTTAIMANKIVLAENTYYLYNCSNANSFMVTSRKDDRVLKMLDMTQYTKKTLPEEYYQNYLSILNTFEIKNLFGWFLNASVSVQKRFYPRMKKIISNMETPVLFEEEKKIKQLVDQSKRYTDLSLNIQTMRIFKIIKFTIRDNKVYFMGFKVGKIKTKNLIALDRF